MRLHSGRDGENDGTPCSAETVCLQAYSRIVGVRITNVLTDKSNSHAVFNAQSIIFGVPVFLVLGSIHNLPRGGGGL